MFDPHAIRKDFPIFQARPELIYLDTTATSQRPQPMLDAMDHFSRTLNANVHRGIYQLAEQATNAYEASRAMIAKFFSVTPDRLIFTRNATESINLVARTWGDTNLKRGDTILLTEMEHHANIVPWQQLAQRTGATLVWVPVLEDGRLDRVAFTRLLAAKPAIVALTHMSNVLGTVNPLAELIPAAHAVGAVVLIDGAQSAAHMPVDVAKLDADFFVFSGHKMLGPFGIGGLIGKRQLLDAMPPFMTGGDMIREVTKDQTTWNDVPYKFEAGTPNASGAIGLAAAVDYLSRLGMNAVWQHERELIEYALEQTRTLPGFKSYGPVGDDRGGILAFTVFGCHPHDLASLLDEKHVAVRAGHHCAQPLHARFGVPATTRASFGVYTTREEIDAFVAALREAVSILT